MLVLSRHRDESIVIGDEITITVVDIRSEKVRLGVSAPRDVPVHRSEVYAAIRRRGGELCQPRGDSRTIKALEKSIELIDQQVQELSLFAARCLIPKERANLGEQMAELARHSRELLRLIDEKRQAA